MEKKNSCCVPVICQTLFLVLKIAVKKMDKDPTFEELKFQCYVYYIIMSVFVVQPELFSKIILGPPEGTAFVTFQWSWSGK